AGDVVSEADARLEAGVNGIGPVLRHAGIAGKEQSGRGVGINGRDLPFLEGRDVELFDAAAHFAPREYRLPAYAVVEREAVAGAETVLRVEADELIAVVLEFACALAEALNSADQEAGDRIIGDVRGELICGAPQKLVVQVYAADLGMAAERPTVPPFDPVQIVGKGVIRAGESRRRVVAELEKPGRFDILDGFCGRLVQLHAEVIQVRDGRERSADG